MSRMVFIDGIYVDMANTNINSPNADRDEFARTVPKFGLPLQPVTRKGHVSFHDRSISTSARLLLFHFLSLKLAAVVQGWTVPQNRWALAMASAWDSVREQACGPGACSLLAVGNALYSQAEDITNFDVIKIDECLILLSLVVVKARDVWMRRSPSSGKWRSTRLLI